MLCGAVNSIGPFNEQMYGSLNDRIFRFEGKDFDLLNLFLFRFRLTGLGENENLAVIFEWHNETNEQLLF